MNKDLLFFIIGSYDWLVAHDARTHTRTHTIFFFVRLLRLFVFLLLDTPTDTNPLASGGP